MIILKFIQRLFIHTLIDVELIRDEWNMEDIMRKAFETRKSS